MFKKIMATAVLVCTIPAMASASWFLTTQAKSAGGYIDTVNKNGQRVIDGLMFKSYTTAGDINYKVEADAGYAIRSVTAGGTTTTAADGAPLANPFQGTIAGSKTTDKGVTATFVADKLAVTAGIGYGSVSPSKLGNIYYNTKLIKAVTFVFTPKAGYQITAVNGLPTGITATPAAPAVNERVMVTFPAGYAFTAPVALNATVANVTKAIAPILTQNVVVGATATMTAVPNANVVNPVYAWTYISGPKNTIVTNNVGGNVSQTVTAGPVLAVVNPTSATASFVAPTDAGQYKFKVVVTADGGTTLTTYATVNVLNTQADAANQCQFCHTANKVGDPSIGTKWAASAHATSTNSTAVCTTCHVGAGTGGHPGQAPTSATCTSCHTATVNVATNHSAATDGKCIACHDAHSTTMKANQVDGYVGSVTCGVCHTEKYDSFAQSGHNFKINKVVNNAIPVYPFSNISGALENMQAATTLNTLGKPTSYSDVTYVVGGYAWKARWIDKNGYLVSSTTGGVQYNLAYPATNQVLGQGWSTYGSVNKKYTCGECHTTGWKYYAGTDAAQKQDGLPGMPGTWVEAGVQCEACHGPGKTHALSPATDNITKVAAGRTQAQMQAQTGYGNPIACGECHTRDGERNPYGGEGAATDGTFRSAYNVASGTNDVIGGRIRASALNNPIGGHHQTGDEMFGVDPDNLAAGPMGKHLKAGVTCGTCHNPHKTTFYQNVSGDGLGVDVACTSCHEVTFTATGAAHSNADCITCHMPKLAKSAVNTGPNAAGKTLGDIKTHVFKIDLAATTNVAAADGGKFLKPFITSDYACGACHATPATKVANLNANQGGKIHGKIVYKHAGVAIADNITPPTTGNTCGTCHGTKPANPGFVGAATCASCHSDTHAQWEKSFHTLKASYGPGFEGQTAGNSNIHPWVLANWDNAAAKLLPHAILGQINSNELYVSKERSLVSDVGIVVGQVRKQRYAVYDSGAARDAVWVAYTNNGGINWDIKTVDGTPYKLDGTGGTPVEVAYPESKARAGYKFLMIEVDLTKATPAAKAANYGEHRSWQERCIGCHTTGFDKAAWDTAKAAYVAGDASQPDLKDIFVSDIRISCEACHGPGEGHKMENPTTIADNETRKMVCNQCHTRTQKNLIDTNAHDNRGFVLGQTAFTDVMQYTRPAWGTGNRQVSIDGKGRRDHQQDMDIRMTEYVHTELQGKPASYHGQQSCFDCHATHTIGSSVELQTTALGGRNHLTVASDTTGLFRLKDTREALCGSCHTGDGTNVLPGSINVATALARLNGATGWGTYGWATSPQNGPFATATWNNEGGRGSRNQHVFNSQQYDDAGVTKTRMFVLDPSEYIWSVLTTNVGSTTASHYTAIWPWERTLPEYTTNRTIVYGPIAGPPAARP